MLEGCRRLGLDTRVVCRAATERSVETLIRRLDGRLRFGRNYEAGMRPTAKRKIWLAEQDGAVPLRSSTTAMLNRTAIRHQYRNAGEPLFA